MNRGMAITLWSRWHHRQGWRPRDQCW